MVIRVVVVFSSLLLPATAAHAEVKTSFAAGGLGLVPGGQWRYVTGPGFAPVIEVRERLSPRWALFQRFAPIFHVDDDYEDVWGGGVSTRELTLLAGARADVGGRMFVEAGLGVGLWDIAPRPFSSGDADIAVPFQVGLGARATSTVDVTLAAFVPDLILGGLTNWEVGAHGGPFQVGLLASVTYTFHATEGGVPRRVP